ncbi:hypothetical protein BC832DRAFT_327420 [Gaertneriomyces semiglobifer]|nr:hypothetical protein BC832DRAFT_327420 [Gaertneriomyces semiglobifer]
MGLATWSFLGISPPTSVNALGGTVCQQIASQAVYPAGATMSALPPAACAPAAEPSTFSRSTSGPGVAASGLSTAMSPQHQQPHGRVACSSTLAQEEIMHSVEERVVRVRKNMLRRESDENTLGRLLWMISISSNHFLSYPFTQQRIHRKLSMFSGRHQSMTSLWTGYIPSLLTCTARNLVESSLEHVNHVKTSARECDKISDDCGKCQQRRGRRRKVVQLVNRSLGFLLTFPLYRTRMVLGLQCTRTIPPIDIRLTLWRTLKLYSNPWTFVKHALPSLALFLLKGALEKALNSILWKRLERQQLDRGRPLRSRRRYETERDGDDDPGTDGNDDLQATLGHTAFYFGADAKSVAAQLRSTQLRIFYPSLFTELTSSLLIRLVTWPVESYLAQVITGNRTGDHLLAGWKGALGELLVTWAVLEMAWAGARTFWWGLEKWRGKGLI